MKIIINTEKDRIKKHRKNSPGLRVILPESRFGIYVLKFLMNLFCRLKIENIFNKIIVKTNNREIINIKYSEAKIFNLLYYFNKYIQS